jgi:hypothetical protein
MVFPLLKISDPLPGVVKAEDLKTSLSKIRVLSGTNRRVVFYVAKRQNDAGWAAAGFEGARVYAQCHASVGAADLATFLKGLRPEKPLWIARCLIPSGVDGRTYKIRTCDQRIKSPLLYQLS